MTSSNSHALPHVAWPVAASASPRRPSRIARLLRASAAPSLAVLLSACSSETPIPSSATGGASSGGTSATTGGSASVATGGDATGGATVSTGGLSTGGTATGGADTSTGGQTGGASNGGAAGASGGANATGGAAGMSGNGGAAGSSGNASGGSTSGGNASGGNTNGGSGGASGGASAGGSTMGGSAGSTSGGGGAGGGTTRPARVLLYSFSTLDIPSVPAQLTLFKQKLEGWQFQVDQSKDPAVFTDANLAKYAAVGMINTCFSPFGANKPGTTEAQALQKFLQAGGGLFGTHCADVTFQSANPPHLYNKLIGGRASSENFDGTSDCQKMGDHPTIAQLPETFRYTGNLDGTDFIGTDTTVLVKCTWGNTAMKEVAVSWVRNEGSGRVFFTNFGKVDGDLSNATIGDKHILAGLGWVLGR